MRPHLIAACALLGGCAGESSVLVDLRTDLVPGVEFELAETTLRASDSEVGATVARAVVVGEGYVDGVRIASYEGVASGSTRVEVVLRDADGTVVAERDVVVDFAGGTVGVTVVVTRDCRGVTCPAPEGDPTATECLAGRCAPPECFVENPETCPPPLCSADADCTGTSECASFECQDGACLARAIPGACAAAEWCNVERGCVPFDDTCVPGSLCETGNPCERGEVDCSTGGAVCRVAGAAPSGTPCRAAASACDAPETCDGVRTTCPGDGLAPSGTPCPDGYCNGLGTCGACTEGGACATASPCELGMVSCATGAPVCVPAAIAPTGTSCRPSAGPCDVPEQCDGTSSICPADAFADSSTPCRPAAGLCDAAESCSGSSPDCPADDVLGASSVCRPAMTVCDADERCNGSGIGCPVNTFAPASTACRPTAAPCDEPESCTGAGAVCPADAPPTAGCSMDYRTAGTVLFPVPVGCESVRVRVWGAGGGYGLSNVRGGGGGYAEAILDTTPGENLRVAVGAGGQSATSGTGALGGAPGGGNGGNGSSSQAGGGGGGFSGVFRGVIAAGDALVIAGGGGGGGGGNTAIPGAGGGTSGQTGGTGGGGGGTQTAGGAPGTGATAGTALQGGRGGNQSSGDGGGGGGGGWFGGGGGQGANSDAGPGGGGSGYVTPGATGPMLDVGVGLAPARPSAAERMGAGDPRQAGAVLLECQ